MTLSKYASKVLIIDDSEFSRSVIYHVLQNYGITDILVTDNGESGLMLALEQRPHLIISDLMMHGMDGYTFCRQAKANPILASIPIIVQTGVEEASKRAEAFRAGATDVLLKPIHAEELVARIESHLEKQRLMTELETYRQHAKAELESARQVQLSMLPSAQIIKEIEKTYPCRIASFFTPSDELSGDFWGVFPLNPSQLALYLVDFSGHGMQASLNTFRLHTLQQVHLRPTADPGAYLEKLNHYLYPMLPTHQMATMLYMVMDFEACEIRYASAAAPCPFIFKAGQHTLNVQQGGGLPLAVRPEVCYETYTIPFNEGDTLMCFSDALTEHFNENGIQQDETYLIEKCIECLEGGGVDVASNPAAYCESILDAYFATTRHASPQDDSTLIALSYQPKNTSG